MYKILRNIMLIIAVIVSNIMSADIAYRYCDMLWGIKYAGYSAPVNIVFWLVIPYVAIILLCIALAWKFNRKIKQSEIKKNT